MEKKELVCICCPLGCNLEVTLDKGLVLKVTGNSCKRGEEYGKKECTNPTRIVTTVLPVIKGDIAMVPVKTSKDIPKQLTKECIKALKNIQVKAPVKIGDIIVEDILNTGANIVATRDVEAL